MVHPLHDRLRRVASQAKRMTMCYAWSWFAVIVISAFILLAVGDYLLRSDELVLRVLASGSLLAALAWAVWRFVAPAARHGFSDLQIADRLERHFPELRGKLANTVSFLSEDADDPLAGSYPMRRAVISETMAALESVDLRTSLDGRSAQKAFGIAVAVCLLLGGLCAAAPDTMTHAASRLFQPWLAAPWPRKHSLAFVDAPERLAQGADFEVEIRDRNGELPETVLLEIQREGQPVQVRDAVFVGGRLLARVNNVSKDFSYRAVGGDDDTMPWRSLSVVEPPKLTSYAAIVTPPSYSGWPNVEYDGDLRGLQGSIVEIRGTANQSLKAATLMAGATPETATAVAELDVDGNAFASTEDHVWRLEASGNYWVEVVDSQDVSSGGRRAWSIEVLKDAAPQALFEGSDFSRHATTTAVAPLRGFARDDLAVQRVELVYRRGDEEGADELIELWQGSEEPPQRETAIAANESREIEYDWQLAAIPGLQPGDVLEFEFVAYDYAGQRGTSAKQQLTIVTQSELEDRLARRQNYALERIADAVRVQREARQQLKDLEIQWKQTKAFRKSDGDQMQSAELNQRQVDRLLAGTRDGAMGIIDKLRADIENNQIQNQELTGRLGQLHEGIRDAASRLPEIQKPLLQSLKEIRPALAPLEDDESVEISPEVADRIRSSGQVQEEVVASLERLLGAMNQYENYRRFAREVGRIQREQAELEEQTDARRVETLTRQFESLSPEERAGLLQLAERQLALAQRMDKLQSRMRDAAAKLADQDPLASETLTDGVDASQQLAISGRMREIANRIGSNQLGQAKETQDEVNDGLSELLDILGNRREDQLDRKLRKLNELDQAIAAMESQEQAVADALAAEADKPNPDERTLQRLTAQQTSLANEAEQAARRLERLEAAEAGRQMRNAASAMQQSGQAGEQQQPQNAAEQAKSALEDLQKAREQLQQQIRKTQQDLMFERRAQLEQQIRGIALRQQSIVQTVAELKAAAEQSPLASEQTATVRRLSQHQNDVRLETMALGERVSETAVFALALDSASREMARASRYLAEDKLADAEAAARIALARLEQVLESLQPEPPGETGPPQQQQQGPPTQAPPSELIHQLAQLKLVKLMQEEIQHRTQQLEKLNEDGPLTPEQTSEYQDLSQEQGQLADIIDEIVQAVAQAAAKAEAEAGEESLEDALEKSLQGGSDETPAAPPGDTLDKSLKNKLLDDLLELPKADQPQDASK